MKVLFIINDMNTGGAESLLLNLLPKLKEYGVHADLLTLVGKKYPFYKALEEHNCCQIFSINAQNIYHPKIIFKLSPFFKGYDIVHVHLFPTLYWVAMARMISFSKATFIYTEHSTSNRRRKKAILKVIDRLIYRKYKSIVSISVAAKVALEKHLNFSEDKFVLIENGIDLERIRTAKPLEYLFFEPSENQKIIVQISRFYYPKDQATVIKSLALLPSNVKLLLVGEGEKLDECRQLVKAIGMADRVRFLGNRSDVPALLQTATLVVLSSFYEGLSLASIEGLASGKPFIASNVPGLKDVVEGAGILFSAGDEHDLAQKIEVLLSDKTLYEKTASRGAKRAELYDIRLSAQKHIDLYNRYV